MSELCDMVYMVLATIHLSTDFIAEIQSDSGTSWEALFAVSQTFLDYGIKAFKVVNDEANLALLYSNKGRLMRLIAHHHTEENCSLNKAAKDFYNKVGLKSSRCVRLHRVPSSSLVS